MREIVHRKSFILYIHLLHTHRKLLVIYLVQAGQCGNQIGAKVSWI